MPTTEFTVQRLTETIRRAAGTEMTGALRVEGDQISGTLYFEHGRLYFGSMEGEFPTEKAFADAGIEPSSIARAAVLPVAERRFADALLVAGVPAQAVATFGGRAVADTMDRLMTISQGTITVDSGVHPFGARFSFDVELVLRRPIPAVDEMLAASADDEPSTAEEETVVDVSSTQPDDDDPAIGRDVYATAAELRSLIISRSERPRRAMRAGAR